MLTIAALNALASTGCSLIKVNGKPIFAKTADPANAAPANDDPAPTASAPAAEPAQPVEPPPPKPTRAVASVGCVSDPDCAEWEDQARWYIPVWKNGELADSASDFEQAYWTRAARGTASKYHYAFFREVELRMEPGHPRPLEVTCEQLLSVKDALVTSSSDPYFRLIARQSCEGSKTLLVSGMKSDFKNVRAAACYGLARVEAKGEQKRVRQLAYQDPEFEVRNACKDALNKLTL